MKIKKPPRRFCFSFSLYIIIPAFSLCQVPVRSFTPDMYSQQEYAALRQIVGNHKKIPPDYEKQILVALSYFPELINTRIDFRFKHTNTSFSTRPTIISVLKRSGSRKYIITISDSSEAILTPLQLRNLDYNAQIGIIGHELSHAADFSNKSTLGLLRVAMGNLSRKFLDRLEFKTDSLCIAHGLGYQLLAWSGNLRKKMNSTNWRGPDYAHKPQNTERYMNPATIQQRINISPLYHSSE